VSNHPFFLRVVLRQRLAQLGRQIAFARLDERRKIIAQPLLAPGVFQLVERRVRCDLQQLQPLGRLHERAAPATRAS
jgi:hypothetical protein